MLLKRANFRQCQVKVGVRNRIASGYLRGTTYLRTPFIGKVPVVTLNVKGAEAVTPTT